MSEPWKGDPEQRKRAVRFGLLVFFVIFAVMTITALSRLYGW